MLKVLGDFTPYGKEFVSTYPHLAECSQSTRSLMVADFTKLGEQQNLKRPTVPQARTKQAYQLSSTPVPTSTQSAYSISQLQNGFPVDEELYVHNDTVIWSRGRHIIKTFQYELQSVEMALFAWFPIDQHECNDNMLPIDQIINNKKRKIAFDSKVPMKKKCRSTMSFTNSLVEAAQQNKYTPPFGNTTNPLPTFTHNYTGDKIIGTAKKLQKAACIILKDCVKIHFMDGKHHSIHLPFTVHQVMPSDVGLIIERASHYNLNTTSHKGKSSDPFASGCPPSSAEPSSVGGLSVSPFLCLVHPAEELKPIFFFDQLSMPSTSLFDNNDSAVNFFQQQQLVYASFTVDHTNDNHDPLPTLVVTKSRNTGLHSIWQYQTVSGSRSNPQIDSSDDEDVLEESKSFFQMTPSFHLDTYQHQQQQQQQQHRRQPKQDQANNMRKQGRRSKRTQFGMKSNKRRQRQQKQQQVSPDPPFGGGGGNNNSSILYHSPSPSPSLTTRKDSFLAGSRSFIQGDEDASVLSMAFSGDNNSMVALYQDALYDNHSEKCQLQHLWTEERRPHTNPTGVSRGFLSHNAKGLLVLCIMCETEGILIGIVVKDLLSSKYGMSNVHHGCNQPVAGFHVDAKQALPIYNATRSGNVADILLLDHQNKLLLFVDSQLPCLPVLCPSEGQQRQDLVGSRLIKIQDAVDNRFNLVIMKKDNNGIPDYRTKRCQIDDITAGAFYYESSNRALVTNSSMALRCAWASSLQWVLFLHQSLQLQDVQTNHLDGWEMFVTTLISMIPLVPLPASTSISTRNSTHYNEKTAALYKKCMIKAYELQKKLQKNDTNYYITDPQNLVLVIRSLHVLYQDFHVSKFIPKKTVTLLGSLLCVLARIVGSSSWINCYCKYDISLEDIPYQLDLTSLQRDYQPESSPMDNELISLDRPFIFESWMHYHLPQDSTTSLSELYGVPTLDPERSNFFPKKDEKLTTDALIATSTNSKIQRRHNEFGFKLKMIWYIYQTMHFYLSSNSSNVPPLLPASQSPATSAPQSSSPASLRSLDTGRQEWIKAIVKKGYCRNDLEMIPDTCVLLAPLLNTLVHLQLIPPTDQSKEFYKFIGRNDMVAQLDHHQTSSIMNNAASLSTYDLKLLRFSSDKKNGHRQNISQLIAPSTMNHTGLPTGNNVVQTQRTSMPQHGASNLILSQFFYGGGACTLDTLKHVRTMLNPCHLVEMMVPDQTGISEENLDMINQGYLKDLVQRTLAISIGNGIFHYGHQHSTVTGSSSSSSSSSPSPNTPNASNTGTETSNRPLTTIEENISISVKLLPLRRTITWDDKAYRPEYFDWPRFHHGVATALRLSSPRISLPNKNRNGNGNGIGNVAVLSSSDTRLVSGSTNDSVYLNDGLADDDKNDLCWLFYVEPEELNVFHGGLLFGLGLNGHLLPNLHWYRYITQTRCSLVTIGFILGTCVTFRGSKNTDITKILSVHVPALLAPQTAATAATAVAAAVAGASSSIGGGVPSSSSRRIPGGDDLMTSSCLFGLGLIFMGSCDRYMTSVMLNEIGECSKRADANYGSGIAGDPSSSSGHNSGGRPTNNMESACALAAGFALGFIMLGKGGNASKELGGLPDAQLFDTLYNYMTGKTTNVNHTKSSPSTSTTSTQSRSFKSNPDHLQSPQPQHREHKQQQGKGTQAHYSRGVSNLLDITTPAATIALGLTYLKTENHRIAERLDICDTTKPYLNYVRPDFLLLRVVSKNLILWQSIAPSQDWIDDQLPSFMHPSQQQHGFDYSDNHENISSGRLLDETSDGMNEQVINQAKYNIVAGACLCLGLRFAGSQDSKAFDCLLNHFDTFLKLTVAQATTFQDNITRSAVWVCIDVIATAAAMVMAGTGNDELYKRLKVLHDRIPFGGGVTGSGKYGNHMASHMALGLLFCGLGRYTLKTTNEAIAGLLCSFYPFYPVDSEDQRSHLQAFRHLWVIGLDQRWLTPFDCDTKQPCQVPLLLSTTNSLVTGYQNLGDATEHENNATEDSNNDYRYSDKVDDNTEKGCDDGFGVCGEKNVLNDQQGIKQRQHQCRVVAPSVVPNYDTLHSIQLDSSLYYPLNINMQAKGDYQQAIRQSGILFVQKKH